MKKLILSENDYELKMALIEDDKINEILFDRKTVEDLTGNFYKARIDDIFPEMNMAFLDIGLDKRGFLPLKKIKKEKLHIGNTLLVQVKNNARDEKGAELTLDYSIPSKNLIFLPNSNKISYSKKININREEIEDIFKDVKNKGLILRSSIASNLNAQKLLEEYNDLEEIWESINIKFNKNPSTKLIYKLNDFFEKIVREYVNDDLEEIITDSVELYEKLKERNLKIKLSKYLKDIDIFEYYSVDVVINQALSRKVYLKSGAYIIIEKTEALISIDVNTGENIANESFEKTVYETNLEASIEIARQLRLRNLSGIIVIDFIDMKNLQHRKNLLTIFEKELKKDRLRVEIKSFSDLGLVEMTRKRVGKELSYYFNKTCPLCKGSAYILSDEAIILNILKDIKQVLNDKDISTLNLEISIELINLIKKDYLIYIETLLNSKKKKINFIEKGNLGTKYYNLKLCK